MNPFRSVGARLSLALAIVVAAALALVGLIVVPSLQRNLMHAKLAQLRASSGVVKQDLTPIKPYRVDDDVRGAAETANARVFILEPLGTQNLSVFSQSSTRRVDVQKDPVALRALRDLAVSSGTVRRGGQSYAEVARPLTGGYILLLTASLHDSLGNINLVRDRLVIAGLIALLAAMVVGYGAASVFARRLRRLERAADRIAGGDFSDPVSDPSSDEVGELARAFERMRLRLAGLERARREFIANASHELRTPLFSLGGFLELMENEDLDPETQREFLMSMREQIERLTKLATELLDLSRLDAGRLHVETEPFDLDVLARTLAGEFSAVAHSSGHTLAVANGSAVTAVGDEERALQIGRILLENAIVHTPNGTNVWLATARSDGGTALLVEDDGPGIPPDDAPHVFERFYRVEGSVASGSGLGLAIARELASLMGGSVELRNTSPRTTFALVLPAAHEQMDVVSREKEPLELTAS